MHVTEVVIEYPSSVLSVCNVAVALIFICVQAHSVACFAPYSGSSILSVLLARH